MLILLNLEHEDVYTYDTKAIAYNEKHYEDMLAICKPFFDKHQITDFEYTHFFNNDTCIYLSTNKGWHEHFIKNYARSSLIKTHLRNIFVKGVEYHRWDTSYALPLENELAEFIVSRRKFNLWHDFTIYEHYQESIVAFTFSTAESNYHINNFYINNINLLAEFIMYFYEHIGTKIKPPNNLKSFNPQKYLFYDCIPSNMSHNGQGESTHEMLPITEYRWVLSEREIYLTPKELECMCYLTQGQSKEETAFHMGKISPHTVDTHEYNVKNKTGIRNRNKLRKEFTQSMLYKLCQ